MLEPLRKKLLWRATHRGIKEMDILVGGFAARRLAGMAADELAEFERILDIPDQDLLAWATAQGIVPPEKISALLLELLGQDPK